MVQLFDIGGTPFVALVILLVCAAFVYPSAALVWALDHRRERQGVRDLFAAIRPAGSAGKARLACDRHPSNRYLQVVGAGVDGCLSGRSNALAAVYEASVRTFGSLAPMNRRLIVLLALFSTAPLAVALPALTVVPSVRELVPEEAHAETGRAAVSWSPNEIRRMSGLSIQVTGSLILFLPLLLCSVLGAVMLLADNPRFRHVRGIWYALKTLEDCDPAREAVWREHRTRLEASYAGEWNWSASLFHGVWFLAKGMVVRGLVLLILSFVPVIGLAVPLYCGWRGNALLAASRDASGKDLF